MLSHSAAYGAGATQGQLAAVQMALVAYDKARTEETNRRVREEAEFMRSALRDIFQRGFELFGQEPANTPNLGRQVTVWRHEVLQSTVSADLEYPGVAVRGTKYRLFDTCHGEREGVRLGLLWFECPDCRRQIQGHDLPLFCLAGLGHTIERGCVDAPDFLPEKARAAGRVAKAKAKGKLDKAQRIINRLRVKEIRQHARGCPRRKRYWTEEAGGRRLPFPRR